MRKQEQWGIDTSASLLISSIRVCVLKRKTRFLVGQTFVAYRGSILAKLLTSTAFFQQLFNIAWSIILVQCYPHHVEAERQSLF